MMTSLKSFKDKLFQFCLELAWKHWTKLGISGRERAAEKVNPDPEALILLIGFLGNKDLRLLENVVTWLVTNESLVHKPRLKTVLNVDDLTTLKVLSRIFKRTKELGRKSKWDSLEEYCTKRADGMKGATGRADLNLSHADDISRDVRADIGNNRLLFRKLFGTNTRAELLNFFFCGGSGSSKGIAEYLQLSQSTVHKTLGELVDIGLLTQKGRSRNTSYRMVEGYLSLEGTHSEVYFDWANYFHAIIRAWARTKSLGEVDSEYKARSALNRYYEIFLGSLSGWNFSYTDYDSSDRVRTRKIMEMDEPGEFVLGGIKKLPERAVRKK